VAAETARRLGAGLLREAMALRGQMSLASYDRLFVSQDMLPAGGVGSLIAAPLFGKARKSNTTVFLDLTTLEPDEDQWALLSSPGADEFPGGRPCCGPGGAGHRRHGGD
jgi:hypothetical protein